MLRYSTAAPLDNASLCHPHFSSNLGSLSVLLYFTYLPPRPSPVSRGKKCVSRRYNNTRATLQDRLEL